jgi:hypothetical protein
MGPACSTIVFSLSPSVSPTPRLLISFGPSFSLVLRPPHQALCHGVGSSFSDLWWARLLESFVLRFVQHVAKIEQLLMPACSQYL